MTLWLALIAAVLLTQAPAAPARPLTPGVPLHASMAGGEQAFYTFDVPAQQAARIRVKQEGVDITLRLARANQSFSQSYVDFTNGVEGEERLYPPVLAEPATWQIRMGVAAPRAARAAITIELDLSQASDADRAVAAARWTFFEGQESINATDGVSMRRGQEKFAAAAHAARISGDRMLEAEATFQDGRITDQLGDSPGSIVLQHRALELFRALGQRDRMARVLNRLGDLSRRSGAIVDSERYFDEALPLARAVNDPASVADILNNSGLLLLATGRAEEALEQLQRALPLAREVNSANVEAALLNNIAEAYQRLGDHERAIEFSLASVPVVKRLNVQRRTGRTFFMLARTYYESGDLPRADAALRESLDAYRGSGDETGYATAKSLQAKLLYDKGDTAGAVALFGEALPVLEQAQNLFARSSLLASWAGIEIERGDYAPALEKLTTAAASSRAIANPYIEALSLYLRARALRGLGRQDEAIVAIQQSLDIAETMRGSIARSELRTSYLAAVRSYYDLYVDLLQQRGDAAAAFEASERARARSLLEGLAESAAKIEKGVDPQLTAMQRSVQRELNAKETFRAELVARSGEQSAAARTAAAEVEGLIERLANLRAQIRRASPAYAALQMPQPITAATLQRDLLDADTAMVAYHLGETRSYAWVIDRDSITVHELPAMVAIDRVARRYHESLSREIATLPAAQRTQAVAAVRANGRELAALVWAPVEARLNRRRVVIVADRGLHYVPFTALPAASGAPLITTHEVVMLPSASVLATLRAASRPVRLNASVAVFADPVFSKNDPRFAGARDAAVPAAARAADGGLYGRLRFSRREAEAIAQRVPGAFQALDFNAAKSTVTTRSLSPYRILHFATHGSLNAEHPELSGLVFSLVDKSGKAVDGFLRLHEIYNLDLDADLVVLSACRTALGREVHGEGLIGLTRGFMYAGATRIVSSVWNVDDRASSLLMSRFYEAMTSGTRSPSAALREAQLAMLKDPRWSSPHYWAAFGIQGEWR